MNMVSSTDPPCEVIVYDVRGIAIGTVDEIFGDASYGPVPPPAQTERFPLE